MAPAVAGLATTVAVGGQTAALNGGAAASPGRGVVVSRRRARGDGRRQWTSATQRPGRAQPDATDRHLPPAAIPAEVFAATATVTAPDAVETVSLSYWIAIAWRAVPMTGDGMAFEASVPLGGWVGEALLYELSPRTRRARHQPPALPRSVVPHGFQAAARSPVPRTLRPGAAAEELAFRAKLESGAFAAKLRLHYREADQNGPFRLAALRRATAASTSSTSTRHSLDDA